MRHLLATTAPFSFAQSLAFMRRFPPCQGELLVEEDAVTAAVTIDGAAVAFTIHGGPELTVEVHGRAPVATVIARAANWIGATDDLRDLYAAAANDPSAIGGAIRHPTKATSIATVVRGVADLGEAFLRTAPYAAARDALLAIPGIGPFSAGAILLRGLGRMDELPGMTWFSDEARDVYGASYDEAAILRRYGRHIGYWSYYLKSGVSLRTRSPRGVRASAHDERRDSRFR